jgi:hypothetical protein
MLCCAVPSLLLADLVAARVAAALALGMEQVVMAEALQVVVGAAGAVTALILTPVGVVAFNLPLAKAVVVLTLLAPAQMAVVRLGVLAELLVLLFQTTAVEIRNSFWRQ